MLLTLELESKIYHPEIVNIARLEILEALRFASEEAANNPGMSPQQAGSAVRRFFEERFPNEYSFRDNTPGLSAGLVLRRTDCSTRALIAHEQLKRMGMNAGVEMIVPEKQGREAAGATAHMYNFIELDGGKRMYFDFGRGSHENYTFSDNKEISARYIGSSGCTAKVILQSTKDSSIYGSVLREPVIDKIRDFCAAFEKADVDLPEFLFANPDWLPAARDLAAFSRAQDRLIGTKESEAWEKGTQDSIRGIYPAFFKPENAATR